MATGKNKMGAAVIPPRATVLRVLDMGGHGGGATYCPKIKMTAGMWGGCPVEEVVVEPMIINDVLGFKIKATDQAGGESCADEFEIKTTEELETTFLSEISVTKMSESNYVADMPPFDGLVPQREPPSLVLSTLMSHGLAPHTTVMDLQIQGILKRIHAQVEDEQFRQAKTSSNEVAKRMRWTRPPLHPDSYKRRFND
jgi:hypothetical protein